MIRSWRKIERAIAVALLAAAATLAETPRADGAPPLAAAKAKATPAIAFSFGGDVPPELIALYDRIVVDPDRLPGPRPSGSTVWYARVPVGEIDPKRPFRARLPKHLVRGKNPSNGRDVVDTRFPATTELLMEHAIEPLWARGYRGFLLEGLDAHRLYAKDAKELAAHLAGLAGLVKELKKRHPDARVLLDDGFDLVPHVAGLAEAAVTHGLFETHDGLRYAAVSDVVRDALLARIRETQEKHGLPVVVVDRVDPRHKTLRRETAKRIRAVGLEPWVAGAELDDVGVGRLEIVPRRVLVLYKPNSEEAWLGTNDAAILLGPVLEYHGLVPVYYDVRKPLPSVNLVGRYAGVVSLVHDGTADDGAYRAWLLRQVANGVRLAFVSGFGFGVDGPFLSKLGLAQARETPTGKTSIALSSSFVGFEAKPRPRVYELPPARIVSSDLESGLRLEDEAHKTWDAVVFAPWGGAAFAPYVLDEGPKGARRWILDPFKFLQKALDLPPMPAPDVTTESGRRILTIHIDGDGFVSRAEMKGNPYTAQVILDEILKKYRVPHTVSVIEGEVGPAGRYPEQSPKLEPIARQIFALPYVELATHTLSHPFFWEDAEAGKTEPHGVEPVHLPIPNYKFDLERELAGSIRYIEERLAPKDKRVKVVLWTGDCSPTQNAVAMTSKLGVFNVNGGGATRSNDMPSLTLGSPMGIPKENGSYQVFAPVENENVYTNDFLGPFYGYRRAIETFELNEWPRRLSTITIYYHFYSGAKTAALVALDQVYAWAVKQESTPLYLSEYAAKVLAFQDLVLARRVEDGAWEIPNAGELRTLRLDRALGWPDPARSTGVAGARDVPQGRYVTLSRAATRVVLATADAEPASPRISDANGRVVSFEAQGKGAKLRVSGHMPLSISIAGIGPKCRLRTKGGVVSGTAVPGAIRFTTKESDTGEASLECP